MNDLIDAATKAIQTPPQPESQLDYILVDASGSMGTRWDDSMLSVDTYVDQLKVNGTDTKVRMATFNTNYAGSGDAFNYRRVRESDAPGWQPVYCDDAIEKGGYTPLYDAINEMGREIRDLNPTKCSVVIVTDGDENHSKTTVTQAKAILDWLRRKGFQITFIGCDFENSQQAKLLGAKQSDFIGLNKGRLSEATKLLAQKRHHYDKYGKPMGFDDDEKTQLGGLLADHSNAGPQS
jgi:hypothetical protein